MIQLHNRPNGTFITTIQSMPECSWVINNKGKCTLPMSVRDEKAIRRYMGHRHLIYITHDKLIPWGGVIETDQDWDDAGNITFTAWSGESLLISRTPTIGLIKAASAGALFQKLMGLANQPEDLLIRMGSVVNTGGPAEVTLDGTDLLEVVRDLAQRHDMEFSIDPILNDRKILTFQANWYKRQGVRKVLRLREGEGGNMRRASNPLRVTRRVINQLTGFGEGSGDDSRPKHAEPADAQSRADYGLMQGTEDYDGVTSNTTLQNHVQTRQRVLRNPRDVIKVVALDVGDTFANLGRGNVLPMQSPYFGLKEDSGIGMQADIRILGMRYSYQKNECELTNNTETEE
jgi:hypothetical protein